MRIIQEIAENEMVAEFLRATMTSPQNEWRVLPRLRREGRDSTVIHKPHLGDAIEDAYRASILSEHYGYRRNEMLFTRFPDESDIRWRRAVMARAEITRIKYLRLPAWERLSGGSRLVLDGARAVSEGRTDPEIITQIILNIGSAVQAGTELQEPILVAHADDAAPVLLDGHHRVTGYFLQEDTIPTELPVIIGVSSRFVDWPFY